MADLYDTIFGLGGGEIRGNRVIIPRGGRAPEDFLGLNQLGRVDIKAKEVIVTLNKAQRKILGLERAAERAARKTERATLKASRPKRKGRFVGATDEGANIGPLSMTRTGVRMNQRFLRHAAGGAFTVAVAGNIVGAGLNAAADLGDKIGELRRAGKDDKTIAKAALEEGGRAGRALLEEYSGASSIVKGVIRLAGLSEQDTDDAIERARNARSGAENIEKLRTEKKNAVIEAQHQVTTLFRKLWDRINHTVPRTFSLRGQRELELYRRDMTEINQNLYVREDALAAMARRAAMQKYRNVP